MCYGFHHDMRFCFSDAMNRYLENFICCSVLWGCLICAIVGTFSGKAVDQNPVALAAFYDLEVVQDIRLTIALSDQERMMQALPERIYVPAVFSWRDTLIENVGIRFKGNSSSSPNQRHKRSYLIKFNKHRKGVRFLGMRRIALDNGVQFGGLFSEPIITGILRDLDIPAARCNYARVYVNNVYQGVYVNVERIDESFIESRFGKPIGPLFKGEGGPGANLEFVGDNAEVYKKGFEPKSDRADQAYNDLIRFIKTVSGDSSPTDPEVLGGIMELKEFQKTIAVMLFAGAFDQLTGWGPHNYYLYQNSDSGRWHYLPWDLDVGFADNAFGKVPVIDGWNAAWPIPGGPPRPLLEKIVTHSMLLKEYRTFADQILETHFQPNHLRAKVDSLYALIKQDLALDPHPARRATNPEDTGYDDVVESIKEFMGRRYQLARRQLDAPGTRPKRPDRGSWPPRNEGPQPGRLEGVPSEVQIVSRDAESIQLAWKDNADGEVGHIVQRADGTVGSPFRNHIGQPGEGITNAIDRQIILGATYRYRVYAVFPTRQGPAGSKLSEVVISDSISVIEVEQ